MRVLWLSLMPSVSACLNSISCVAALVVGPTKAIAYLSQTTSSPKETRKRIDIMCDTNDGFEIAEADLKLRGPG